MEDTVPCAAAFGEFAGPVLFAAYVVFPDAADPRQDTETVQRYVHRPDDDQYTVPAVADKLEAESNLNREHPFP